jgi:glutaredoxin/glutathione-dependent peroxiredoxin
LGDNSGSLAYLVIHKKEKSMIQLHDRLPDATLYEFIETPREGCSLGPHAYQVLDLVKGKKIVLFAVPGAFTPTCSAQHLPGFIAQAAVFKAKGIDEIWCLAVNDAFVMGAWGRQHEADGAVRLFSDGGAELTQKMGLTFDLTAKGFGIRSQRYAMIIDDGVVMHLAVEAPGKFEVSSAEAVLAHLNSLD